MGNGDEGKIGRPTKNIQLHLPPSPFLNVVGDLDQSIDMKNKLSQQLNNRQLGLVPMVANLIPLLPNILNHVKNHNKRRGALTETQDPNKNDTP